MCWRTDCPDDIWRETLHTEHQDMESDKLTVEAGSGCFCFTPQPQATEVLESLAEPEACDALNQDWSPDSGLLYIRPLAGRAILRAIQFATEAVFVLPGWRKMWWFPLLRLGAIHWRWVRPHWRVTGRCMEKYKQIVGIDTGHIFRSLTHQRTELMDNTIGGIAARALRRMGMHVWGACTKRREN